MGASRRASNDTATSALVALCVAGFANAVYMLSYHLRVIDRMWCPVFGDGCEIAARAREARHFGVPNAAVGAAGYVALATLATVPAPSPKVRSYPLAATALAAWVTSAYLLWEQAVRVRRWCFWCITGAVINSAILPLALYRGHRMARG